MQQPAATTDTAVSRATVEDPHEFLNRELTWLTFNQRVLYEAMDERTPLLERVFFMGIFTSNLDEFFMKRVGGLRRQVLAKVVSLSVDGLTPQQQLTAIRASVEPMLAEQARSFKQEIKPALAEHGVHLLSWKHLTDAEREFANRHFRENVFPVLTPMAVDPGHPFPFLSNLSLSLGVKLSYPGSDELVFARVKVPEMFDRWVRLEGEKEDDLSAGTFRFVSLVDVITQNMDVLFPGMDVHSVTPFRVTRNADVERDEEDAEDLLELIEQELRERRFARIVRLEHHANADQWTLDFVMRELELSESDVYQMPGLLDYTDLKPITKLELPQLKYKPWTPITPPRLADKEIDIFNVISSKDLLVHHPYENFSESVERLISRAAADRNVLAIKLTLYRIGESRSLMNSLTRAAESGKQVVCLVELKARFDEQRNIYWAQELERAGVHVFYGLVGLKTHTKLAMVVRQEAAGLKTYVHVGTGNYNVTTARLYTDLGLLTCKPHITGEVVELFHYLTGRSLKGNYEHLLVAPVNMRQRFMELIEQEVAHHKAGRPAQIIAKMNSLEDRKIIRALYGASQAGLPIKLIVRGFCCLRPGVAGLSENIQVTSIIGRFLEHSRIYHFRDGQDDPVDGKFYIGSADWMYRNLAHRVELIAPIEDAAGRQKLLNVIHVCLADHRQAWDMHHDGTYTQRQPANAQEELGTHQVLMNQALAAAAATDDEQIAELEDLES